MTKRIERLILRGSARNRVDTGDLVDGVDLYSVLVRHIRDDTILVAGLVQRDRLGGLLEQVDRRCTAELERVDVDVLLQLFRAAVHEQDDLESFREPGPTRLPQLLEIEKQELARESEKLGQQAVARERLAGIGNQTIGELKTDLAQASLGIEEDRFGVSTGGIVRRHQNDLDRIIENKLIEMRNRFGFPAQVEAKAIERQIGEIQAAQAIELQPQALRPFREEVSHRRGTVAE